MTATALMLLLAMVGTSCSSSDGSGNDAPVTVVATTTMLGDLARNVVGESGQVEVILPIGADPHDYQASARQVALVLEADLVVANGLGLEEGLEDVLEGAAQDGALIVYVAEHLDPLPFISDDPEHDRDPHVWLDPLRMADAADLLAAELAKAVDDAGWTARAQTYRQQLVEADTTIDELVQGIPSDARKLVTNHRALGYFADRYGFTVIGAVVPGGSTLADPSSAELADLVGKIREERVPAIFAETTEPSVLAEAVAEEVGEEVAVVNLYTGSLGEEGSGAETLIGLLLTNARRIAEALS